MHSARLCHHFLCTKIVGVNSQIKLKLKTALSASSKRKHCRHQGKPKLKDYVITWKLRLTLISISALLSFSIHVMRWNNNVGLMSAAVPPTCILFLCELNVTTLSVGLSLIEVTSFPVIALAALVQILYARSQLILVFATTQFVRSTNLSVFE